MKRSGTAQQKPANMAGVAPKQRQSYILTVEPVNFSLTEGTNIPPPPPSPPPAPKYSMPGTFPVDDPPANGRKNSMSTVGTHDAARGRADSIHAPMSPPPPATATPTAASDAGRPAVRRMFSLHSLRQSFSSSRTSLALPRPSHDVQSIRPMSPSAESTLGSVINGSGDRPPTSRRRSSSWFGRRRRRSSFFAGLPGGDSALDVVDEDPRESKRLKPPPPRLPEVGTLRGGRLNDGALGWDEAIFEQIEK